MVAYSDLIWGLIFIYMPLLVGFTYGYTYRSREDKNRLLLLGLFVSMVVALVFTLGYLLTEKKIYFNAGVNAAVFSIVGMLIGSLDTSRKKTIVSEAAESTYEPPKPESEMAAATIKEDKEPSIKPRTRPKGKRKTTKKKPVEKTAKKPRTVSKTRKPKTTGKKKAASKKQKKKKPPTS